MDTYYNPLPGIDSYLDNMNPTLTSPYSEFNLPFYQTRETMQDVDTYRAFLKNVEKRFRASVRYTNYKGFLYGLGLDRCQVHGYITKDMAPIEMHHAILTLFDIALMITEHQLKTVGYVTTFRIVKLLKEEHSNHNIPLIMLSETPHQLYHNEPSFFLHPDMCFGNWPLLIEKYKCGLTQDVAFKLLYYLKKAIEVKGTDDAGLLDLKDKIMYWSDMYGAD